MKQFLFLVALWYGTTSFITNADRSLVVRPTEYLQLLKKNATDSFGYFQNYEITLSAEEKYHLRFDQPFTSIQIERVDSTSSELILIASGRTYTLGVDPSLASDNKESSHTFIVFDQPTEQITLEGKVSEYLRISLFYAAQVEITVPLLKLKKEGCEKPITIPHAEWRAGLPDPKVGRESTVVKHCVIHHSAGSNTDTNYVNTVRNIYLFHTNTNGWDDIGYNYVVAPNGWIFDGRDAQDVAEDDNIQGAHFCGKNKGTMGICLLGDYNTATPSTEMISSVQSLLSWKLYKENLDTRDAYPHPTSLDDELPTVAMHRDGCATECPGDNVASVLSDWRVDVQRQLDECNGNVSVVRLDAPAYQLMVYPNPSDGRFYIMIEKEARATHYQMLTTTGQVLENGHLPASGYIECSVPNGLYMLQILADNVPIANQKLVVKRK